MPCDPQDPLIRFLTDAGRPDPELIAELGPDDIRGRLRECSEIAFSIVWDDERARRLGQAGPRRQFAPELMASIDHVLGRHAVGLDPVAEHAAWLMAAYRVNKEGVLRDWPRIDGLTDPARASAVAAMANGRFDAARAVDGVRMLGLLLHPAASQRRAAGDPVAARTAGAVRAALIRCGAFQLFGKINACLLHAVAAIGDDDRFARRDLLAAAGHDEDSYARLADAAKGDGSIDGLKLRGRGIPDVRALLQDRGFLNAAEWLELVQDFDPEVIAMADSMGALAASHPEPWVRWACARASSGEAIDATFAALRPLGAEGIKVRGPVLNALLRSRLLTGDAVKVLDTELEAGAIALSHEVLAFRRLFECRARGQDPAALPFQLRNWYLSAEASYARSVGELASLPKVDTAILEAEGAPDAPSDLGDLIREIRDARARAEELDARAIGRWWLLRLVRHCSEHEAERDRWDGGTRILTDEDANDIGKLVRAMRAATASRWYAIRLQEHSEFRLAEAAFRLRLLGEDDDANESAFRTRIERQFRDIRDASGLSDEERRSLKDLCERCGRHLLGRLADSQPRGATLEAFRRADARGMLRGELHDGESLGIPYRNVPERIASRTATVAWIGAGVLLAAMLLILLFGGDPLPPSGGVIPNG